ncbi:MAG: LLM class flavin-dependent oxidoreductase [Actinomycetota bacterium]|nr:LLM class flavin-dependent oxidoreductase [Actinomycetota bacterium]
MTGFHLGFPSHAVADVPMSAWGELAADVERVGFDTLWHSNERFFRDMFVRMTVSAVHTSTLTLGGAVADGYTTNPAVTAQALATIGELSDGRATLAIGAGGSGLPMMGVKRSAVTETTRAAFESIADLLAGKTVTRQSAAFTLSGAHLKILPPQRVRLWIASRGRRMLEMAGGTADGVMIASQATPQGLGRALDHVRRGAAAHGRDPAALRTMARVDTCVHTDERHARDGCRLMVAKLLWMSYPDRGFVTDAGLSVPGELEEVIARRDYDALEAAAHLVPDGMIDTFCWAGTPEQLVDRVGEVVRAGGISDVGFWLLRAPGQSLDDARALLAEALSPLRERYGREVSQ